jgi:hypothetical protein
MQLFETSCVKLRKQSTMKKLIFIFLLFATSVAGQVHQEDILKFVNDNMGKKVGKGVCYELVQGAVRVYNPSYEMCYIKKDKDRYGKKVDLKSVAPGDIMVMSGGTKHKANHVAIVYKVDDGVIYIADQNTQGSLKNSIVEVREINYEWHEEYYGKVRYNFYRPQ